MSSYEELANLWQGIATGGCEEHFNANPEDYPAECIICLKAALTQARAQKSALMEAIEPFAAVKEFHAGQQLVEQSDLERAARVYEQVKEKI